MKNQKIRSLFKRSLLPALALPLLAFPARADDTSGSSGNVAGAITSIWENALGQIKTICNSVVFPALAVVCGIGFVISVIAAALNYKKHRTVEVGWSIAALIGLLFALSASTWVWTLVGV